MTLYSNTLRDENTAKPIAGATVYVYGIDGQLSADLTDDLAAPIANPLSSDAFGNFSFNAPDGFYTLDFFYGGSRIWKENIIVGATAIDGAKAVLVTSRDLLADVTGQFAGQSAIVGESGHEGTFVWSGDNLAAQVAADTGRGLYVPPAVSTGLATDGSEGAWVRKSFSNVDTPVIRTLSTPKRTARSRAEARIMAADLSSMKGYAASAATTGGAGHTEYWVTNSSDDPNFVGSLRWAATLALAGGGGMILVDPQAGELATSLAKLLLIGASALNVCNITIDAPGRNLTIRNMPKVEGIRLSGQNIIFRRVRITNLPGTYVDGEEKDGLGINPLYSDKIWIDECELGHVSDGIMDAASSALTAAAVSTASGYCRLSATHNIIRNQDKCILLGKSGIVAGALSAIDYRVLALFHENWFHGVGQRTPLVQQFAFADFVNNVIDFAPYQRQDGTVGSCEGATARWGGAVDSRGNLFRALSGNNYLGVGTTADNGAYRSTGDAFEDGITGGSANVGFIPAIPYVLAAAAIPAAGTARDAWAEAIIAKCGHAETPFPPDSYAFRPGAPVAVPDGRSVFPWGDGYYERIGSVDRGIAADPAVTGVPLTRQATKTIAAGVIAIDGAERFFAVDGEAGAADDLVTITGGLDGMEIVFRCVSPARVITVKSTDNINLPADVVLDHVGKTLNLLYDTGSGKWGVRAEYPPVLSVAGRGGAVVLVKGDVGLGNVDNTSDAAKPVSAAQAAAIALKADAANFASATFAPVLTAQANCSALTVVKGQYQRNGSMVTGSLMVSGTQTAASTLTKIRFALPIASDLAVSGDIQGVCCTTGVAPLSGFVQPITATDLGEAHFVCSAAAGAAFSLIIMFQYEVK
jgi:pectate lyase